MFDPSRLIIAHVPVVHRALLEFLQKEKAPILILDEDILVGFSQLKHDLRAVRPEEVKQMLEALGFQAGLLGRLGLTALSHMTNYILPIDEVMSEFAEKFLANYRVEFHSCFTRWYKKNVTSEELVSPDQVITVNEFSRQMMGVCYKTASWSTDWWRQVGAAIVRDHTVLAVGYNQYLPTGFSPLIDGDQRVCFDFGEHHEICGTIHAEAGVIAFCTRKGLSSEGADLYCTTFPCPQCARLIAMSGLKRVFYAEGYSVADARHIFIAEGVEVIKVEMCS